MSNAADVNSLTVGLALRIARFVENRHEILALVWCDLEDSNCQIMSSCTAADTS